MKRMVFVAILGVMVTTGLSADTPPPGVPLAPTQVQGSLVPVPLAYSATMARLNKKGQIVLKVQITRYVPLTATRVLRDGKEVEEKHTIYEPVTRWEDQTYDPKDIKLLGSDGKPLDKKKLLELLKKERPVLCIYGESEIDSTFLKVIKEGTPILVFPVQGPS